MKKLFLFLSLSVLSLSISSCSDDDSNSTENQGENTIIAQGTVRLETPGETHVYDNIHVEVIENTGNGTSDNSVEIVASKSENPLEYIKFDATQLDTGADVIYNLEVHSSEFSYVGHALSNIEVNDNNGFKGVFSVEYWHDVSQEYIQGTGTIDIIYVN